MVNLGLAGFFAVGAYASALLTKRGMRRSRRLAAGAGRGARWPALVVALSTTRLRERLSRHRHAGLRRGRAPRRRQRDLADQRHRRHLRHSAAVEARRSAATSTLLYLLIVLVVLRSCSSSCGASTARPTAARCARIREDAQVAPVAGKPVLRFKVRRSRFGARSPASPARSTATSRRTSRPTCSCR